MFDAVYKRWEELPEDARPKLVVFGESLESYGGQAAFASGEVLVGAPNFAEPWGRITEGRDEGSLERLPIVDGGRNIRFASVPKDVELPGGWEFPRVVFWQVTLGMVFSAEVPDGHGHSYGPDAADLWAEILVPGGVGR